MISYAQNFEDVMLSRALRDVQQGYYVDVGAQHPLVDSVSLSFYERGWRGVHVEPVPEYAVLLRQNRPDETVIQAAVSSTQRSCIQLFHIPNTGLSTSSEEHASSYRKIGFTTCAIEVPCISLAIILDRSGDNDVHWLKIDVEGMEADVLSSWKPSTVRPWIVIVEATKPLSPEPNHFEWEPTLLELGYKFAYFDGLNRFYVSNLHKDLLQAFDTPPNVFDEFGLSGTASNRMSDPLKQMLESARAEQQVARSLASEYERNLVAVREECNKYVDDQRMLNQELVRTRASVSAKDHQIENMQRMNDELRQSIDQLHDRMKADEVAATAERNALHKAGVERENQLLAQLRSMTRLMHMQHETGEQKQKSLGLELREMEVELERVKSELADLKLRWRIATEQARSMLGHWTGKWFVFLHAKMYAEGFLMGDATTNGLSAEGGSGNACERALATNAVSPWSQTATREYQNNPEALLELSNDEFVTAVYHILLGRPADQGGRENYLTQLKGGRPKAEIIYEIATSIEGQKHPPSTPNLARFIQRCRNRRESRLTRLLAVTWKLPW